MTRKNLFKFLIFWLFFSDRSSHILHYVKCSMCTISFNSPKYPVSEVQLSSLFSYHFTNMITSVQNIEVICISSYGGKFQPQHPMFLSMSSYSFSRVSWVFIFSFIGFHFAAVISIFSFTYLFFSQINLLFVIFNLVQ